MTTPHIFVFDQARTLRYQGRIIAMLAHARLTVKLPRSRVDELISEGTGHRFDAGTGAPMREWFMLDARSRLPWLDLAKEALAYAQRPGLPYRGATSTS